MISEDTKRYAIDALNLLLRVGIMGATIAGILAIGLGMHFLIGYTLDFYEAGDRTKATVNGLAIFVVVVAIGVAAYSGIIELIGFGMKTRKQGKEDEG